MNKTQETYVPVANCSSWTCSSFVNSWTASQNHWKESHLIRDNHFKVNIDTPFNHQFENQNEKIQIAVYKTRIALWQINPYGQNTVKTNVNLFPANVPIL